MSAISGRIKIKKNQNETADKEYDDKSVILNGNYWQTVFIKILKPSRVCEMVHQQTSLNMLSNKLLLHLLINYVTAGVNGKYWMNFFVLHMTTLKYFKLNLLLCHD